MAQIIQEEIRATIIIDGGGALLEISTPYVKSFNVSKQRGSMVSSFSATVEILSGDVLSSTNAVLDIADQDSILSIYAGTRGNEKLIFTGDLKSITINPSWEKPEYFYINLGGSDLLSRLEGKRYSRRIKWTGAGMWAKITNIKTTRNRKIARGFDKKFLRRIARITEFPSQSEIEHTSFIYARDLSRIDPYGKITNPEKTVDDTKEGEFTIAYV